MFDLEKALAAWRNSLIYNRTFQPEDIDEMERHIRDQVKDLVDCGMTEERAYRTARTDFGQYGEVESEFRKVKWESLSARGKAALEWSAQFWIVVSYFKVALRTFRRNPLHFGLNLGGLTIGLAASILIVLFIRHENSYDRFHENADRVFRVVRSERTTMTSALLAPSLEADFPGIDSYTRVSRRWFKPRVTKGDFVAMEDEFFFVDSTFFDVFSYPLLIGSPHQVLVAPFSLVITESVARKYFGDEDPIGQVLNIKGPWDAYDFTVTGIAADMKGDSHFQFEFLASYNTRSQAGESLERINTWWSIGDQSYVRLAKKESIASVINGMEAFARKHFSERLHNVESDKIGQIYTFQSITNIHMHSDLDNEFGPNGDPRTLSIFLWVAILIVLVAGLNYVNMATARSIARAREVGVRKVVGAHRSQLITQYFLESAILMVLAGLLAMVTVLLALPWFGHITGRILRPSALLNGHMLGLLVLSLMAGVFLAGGYPALVLSRFRPERTIKGLVGNGPSNSWLRKSLIFCQFGLSVILLFGTNILSHQLDFLQNERLGMNPDQVLVVEANGALSRSTDDTFKERLRQHSSILSVAAVSNGFPIRADMTMQLLERRPPGPLTEEELAKQVYHLTVDENFLETMEIDLIEGRGFDPSESKYDRDRKFLPTIVNRKTVELLGWDDPIGRTFQCCFNPIPRVVGVMEDFHFQSTKEEIRPLAISPSWNSPRILVRISPDAAPAAIEYIEAVWKDIAPDWPLNWTFMNDQFAAAYSAEQRLAESFRLFSVLAVIIACLGLFGLSTLMVQSRIREIGIRKVVGASAVRVITLLTGDLLRPILLSLVVSLPVGGLLAQKWLQDFPYRIILDMTPFIQIAAATVAVAVITISYHTWRASQINPADAIRYE